jgi:RNA polymerase sigma-70 factor, ECF subfamily
MSEKPAAPREPGTALTSEKIAELRRRLLGAIRRVCPAWLQSQAEDITQEALLKVTNILAQEGERDGGLPASYIKKVAYTTTVDTIRRLRQARSSEVAMEEGCEEVADLAPGHNPEAINATGRLAAGVEQCLEDMVEARRTVVVLRLQGHSVPEIGALMGWPQTRANNLVFRGMKDLRDCLEKKGLAP